MIIIPHDPLFEDLSRRGFLKGVGAAAGMAVTGAQAAPFSHGEYKDQMTGKSKGRYSTVKADNGNATLTLKWPGSGQARIDIDLPGKTINFSASGSSGARVKIGNGPVIETYLSRGQSGDYSWGAILDTNLVRKILSHSGELKIEVNIFRTGPEIFKFTIEQDNITKSIPAPKKPEVKKDTPDSDDEPNLRQQNLNRTSAGYASRVASRIKPNITWIGQGEVPQKAEVTLRVSPDGTIIDRRLIKSSGNRVWDDAVLRAINKTEILPRDTDGRAPPEVVLSFHP
jgi:TonB family protein